TGCCDGNTGEAEQTCNQRNNQKQERKAKHGFSLSVASKSYNKHRVSPWSSAVRSPLGHDAHDVREFALETPRVLFGVETDFEGWDTAAVRHLAEPHRLDFPAIEPDADVGRDLIERRDASRVDPDEVTDEGHGRASSTAGRILSLDR